MQVVISVKRWRQTAKIAAVAFVILFFVILSCQQRRLPPPAVPFDPDAPGPALLPPPPGFGTPVAVVDPAPEAHADPEWEEFKDLVIGLLLLFGEYIVLPFGLLIWACWVFGSLFNGLSDIHASNVARHTADEFERRRRRY